MHFRVFKAAASTLLTICQSREKGARSEAWPVALTKTPCPSAGPRQQHLCLALDQESLLPVVQSYVSLQLQCGMSFGLHFSL